MLNATYNNVSVISWQSVLLVEKTTDLSQVTDKLYRTMLHRAHLTRAGLEMRKLSYANERENIYMLCVQYLPKCVSDW